MGQFDYRFTDVPFLLPAPEGAPRHCIALLAGRCEVTFGQDNYNILDITIESPIKGDIDVPLPVKREGLGGADLWKWIAASIVDACEDGIIERIEEIEAEKGAA